MSNLRFRLICIICLANICNICWGIDPTHSSYGAEYTSECFNLLDKEINLIYSKDLSLLNTFYLNLSNRISNLAITERAKFVKKYFTLRRSRIRGERGKSIEENLEYLQNNLASLPSMPLLQQLINEAEDYNHQLWEEEVAIRNEVKIDVSDRPISFYYIAPEKFFSNTHITTNDLRPSGQLLLTKGGIIKAFSDAQGWHKVIHYSKKVVAKGWSQINLVYYVWPYFGDGEYPNTWVIVKDADLISN